MPESTLIMHRWTLIRKAAGMLDLLRGVEAVTLARTHGLSHVHLFAWRDWSLEDGQAASRAPW